MVGISKGTLQNLDPLILTKLARDYSYQELIIVARGGLTLAMNKCCELALRNLWQLRYEETISSKL